jgi:glycosyltransferase involved in cell wall biosynthesis
MGQPFLLYALHSGNLYGTERMALATVAGVADEFAAELFAPPGNVHAAAKQLGFPTQVFTSGREFIQKLRPVLAGHRTLSFVATGVVHSLACIALNVCYRRQIVHLHIIHGGTDERLSYGRKRLLNHLGVRFVAVSQFVKDRLIAHGVLAKKISIIENFLPDSYVTSAPKREPFTRPGIRHIVVVSRIDPIKRIDLLLDALDCTPALGCLPVRILGTGWDLETLRVRAAQHNPNVTFIGFEPEVARELAAADLLVHICPEEPFGLAVLEAMAAGIPVLVPDRGGAGALVADGVSGFHFSADNVKSLAARLLQLTTLSADRLNQVVAGGFQALATRFAAPARLADYRRLLRGESL